MTSLACATPLPPQTDIAVASTSPWGLIATELNPLGFVLPICYRISIQPTGQTIIVYDKELTVTALPLDCSASIADASFAPTTIAYNSGGSAALVVASGYSKVFTHTQ